jgi:hypothetical protein
LVLRSPAQVEMTVLRAAQSGTLVHGMALLV